MVFKVGLNEPRRLAHNKRNDDTCNDHRKNIFDHASLPDIPRAVDESEVF